MKKTQKCVGWYAGTCTNSTVNITANLLLHIHGLTDSRVHGELGLFGDLGGGGPFQAGLNRGQMQFTTCLPALQIVIEWSGIQTDHGLAGSYRAACDAPDSAHGLLAEQGGVWTCAFVQPLDLVGCDRSNFAFVFHAGKREGPFTMEVFHRYAVTNRWPPHALTALEHCTFWSTVGAYLAEVNQQLISNN